MGQRRDRFDKRQATQKATRAKNAHHKRKERIRREARLTRRASTAASK